MAQFQRINQLNFEDSVITDMFRYFNKVKDVNMKFITYNKIDEEIFSGYSGTLIKYVNPPQITKNAIYTYPKIPHIENRIIDGKLYSLHVVHTEKGTPIDLSITNVDLVYTLNEKYSPEESFLLILQLLYQNRLYIDCDLYTLCVRYINTYRREVIPINVLFNDKIEKYHVVKNFNKNSLVNSIQSIDKKIKM